MTNVKFQTISHFNNEGEALYIAVKDYIDQVNMNKIISANSKLFKKVSNPAKK